MKARQIDAQRVVPDRADTPLRDDDTGDAADQRKYRALDQQLPHQPAGRRSDRRADRHLSLACGGSGQQQRAQIGAHNQEEADAGREQHDEGARALPAICS